MAVTHTGAGVVDIETFSQAVPPGILVHAFVTKQSNLELPGAVYARMTLTVPSNPFFTPNRVLAAGHVGQGFPLVWSGFLALSDNAVITVQLAGDINGTYYCEYSRLTNSNIQAIGSYVQTVLKGVQP